MSLLRTNALQLVIDGQKILDGIDAVVEPHTFIALLGPNGSGKTTLLKSLAGILSGGTVLFDDKNCESLDSFQRAAHVLYVGSGLETAFPMTTGEVFQAAGIMDAETCKKRLEELDCARIWGKEVRALSAGERQILLLTRAFLRNPRVLLLDETLSKLDLHHLGLALGLLKRYCEQGGAVVWVSHDWNLSLKYASMAWVLDHGRWIARGKVSDLSWNEILARVFPHSRVRAMTQAGLVQFSFD